MGKLGILWELDRKTGAYVASHDLGYQNILNVDPQTGKVTYRPGMIPEIGKALTFCPSTAGFKDWRAMAYHPETQAFYIPLNLSCEKGTFSEVQRVEGGGGAGGGRRTNLIHPESPEGLGEFTAMDVNGKVLWRHRTRTPMNTAALTTGGGLAIVGDWDRNLYVFDAVEREDPLPDADADLGAGLPHRLCGEGQAISGDSGRHRRRQLGHAGAGAAHARQAAARQRERDLRVRAARPCGRAVVTRPLPGLRPDLPRTRGRKAERQAGRFTAL